MSPQRHLIDIKLVNDAAMPREAENNNPNFHPSRFIMSNTSSLLRNLIAGTTGVLLVAGAAAQTVSVTTSTVGSGVSAANARKDHPANVLPPGFSLRLVEQGADPLENPSGLITNFGYLNDASTQPVEATKTERDQNTYLVLKDNPGGPDADFDYGRHFLFQGHELGNDLAYVTRVNLDVADPDRRITLMTKVGSDGKTHFNTLDGSTYNPSSGTLLLTEEAGPKGGVVELSPQFNRSKGEAALVRTLYGAIGQGGYEGIRPDDRGNIYIVEDVGGISVNVNPNNPSSPVAARNPNSFVYRFIPANRSDLAAGGKLQALQVLIEGQPLVFVPVDATHPIGDVFSQNQLKLHTLGTSYPVRWVTIHDTVAQGFKPFDANAAAKAAGATPFKRPENLAFKPGSDFQVFYFSVTGDTNSDSGRVAALAARGAWGSIFRVELNTARDGGNIKIAVLGDRFHNSFDNLTFTASNLLLAGEDRGDMLHDQLHTLDSIWAYTVNNNGANAGARFVALGRDRLAEIDAAFAEADTPGFQNDGDNETTGILYSDGRSLPGEPLPNPDAVLFFTQQHGENNVYQVVGGNNDHSGELFF